MNSEKDLACEARERLTVPAPVQAQPFSLFSQLAVLAPPSDSAGSPQADQLAEERKSQGIRRRQELGESARKEYTTTILYLLENADNPLPTAQLGRIMGVNRCTAYKRLILLENRGVVLRVGSGVATCWTLPGAAK